MKYEEKKLYGYFKRQTGEIIHEKTWTWLRKGNLLRKTESHSSTKCNYIKAKIRNK